MVMVLLANDWDYYWVLVGVWECRLRRFGWYLMLKIYQGIGCVGNNACSLWKVKILLMRGILVKNVN